jgi:hypothetical protein
MKLFSMLLLLGFTQAQMSGPKPPAWPEKNAPIGTQVQDGSLVWVKVGKVSRGPAWPAWRLYLRWLFNAVPMP